MTPVGLLVPRTNLPHRCQYRLDWVNGTARLLLCPSESFSISIRALHCSPQHPHLNPESHPQPWSGLSLREERCPCHCALLTPCSQLLPLALSNEISSFHRNPPTHGSSLASGLINLSNKKEALCFRNNKNLWGKTLPLTTVVECSWAEVQGRCVRRTGRMNRPGWRSASLLQNQMKGEGNEKKGERKQEKKRRRGKGSWDSAQVKILPILFNVTYWHGKGLCVWYIWQQRSSSCHSPFLQDIKWQIQEKIFRETLMKNSWIFFLFLDILPHDNLN